MFKIFFFFNEVLSPSVIFALAVARHWAICRALGKEEAGAVCSGLSMTCCLLKNANTPVCSGLASCCGHGLYLSTFTTTITCMLEQLVLLIYVMYVRNSAEP